MVSRTYAGGGGEIAWSTVSAFSARCCHISLTLLEAQDLSRASLLMENILQFRSMNARDAGHGIMRMRRPARQDMYMPGRQYLKANASVSSSSSSENSAW